MTRLDLLTEMKCKTEGWLFQRLSKKRWDSIDFPSDLVNSIRDELSKDLPQLSHEHSPLMFISHEYELVERIRQQTLNHNLNNVTRTEAYWQIYKRNPELHWAFLAHMVSRNGGWCMTDLKGELLPKLLNNREIQSFFDFFERSNGLIFQDAYPQLLVYEESKKTKKSCFHLLPAFGVSRFMQPFWENFCKSRNSHLLTMALIINEQYYIEKRVIRDPLIQREVFETLKYKVQETLQLTQVIFPFIVNKVPFPKGQIRLAGCSIDDFTDVDERIIVGKKLYSILFGIKEVYEGALQFAENVPHTGSRSDYWINMFSPSLSDAWPNQKLGLVSKKDWFKDIHVFNTIQDHKTIKEFDMTYQYRLGLKMLELAVQLKITS